MTTRGPSRTLSDILISGAGVAGPALAWWLARRGFRPVIIERSGQLRGGGYAVAFRGQVHLSVLERMGLLEQVRARQTDLGGASSARAWTRSRANPPPRRAKSMNQTPWSGAASTGRASDNRLTRR